MRERHMRERERERERKRERGLQTSSVHPLFCPEVVNESSSSPPPSSPAPPGQWSVKRALRRVGLRDWRNSAPFPTWFLWTHAFSASASTVHCVSIISDHDSLLVCSIRSDSPPFVRSFPSSGALGMSFPPSSFFLRARSISPFFWAHLISSHLRRRRRPSPPSSFYAAKCAPSPRDFMRNRKREREREKRWGNGKKR